MLDFSKYEDFKNDPFLGQSIDPNGSSMVLMGVNGIKSLQQLNYIAGGKKTSYLCGFSIKSAIPEAVKRSGRGYIHIMFVAKMRSRIYRRAPTNPSQWYVFFPITDEKTNGAFRVLSAEECLAKYAIDLHKFFKSQFFKDKSRFLQQQAQKMVKTKVTEFVNSLTDITEKNLAISYMKALEDSIPHITSPKFMDKSYNLVQFNDIEEKDDMPEIPNEAELDKAIEEALKDIY